MTSSWREPEALVVEVGDWEPRRREAVTLPENLPREVTRLVWWLQDVGCVRSPFISHPDCLDVPDMPQLSMCARCRALRPYTEAAHRPLTPEPVPESRSGVVCRPTEGET